MLPEPTHEMRLLSALITLRASFGEEIPLWIMRAWADEAESAGMQVQHLRRMLDAESEAARPSTNRRHAVTHIDKMRRLRQRRQERRRPWK